jgi:hypothetical protein
MKLLDFSNKNYGWPFSADTFQFVQEQMQQLQALSFIGGNTYVIQGCIDNGDGVISNGWVAINGEILPFVGGSVQTNVVIIQTPTTASFGDPSKGVTPQFYDYKIDRIATFGTAGTVYPWANFDNKGSTNGLFKRLKDAEDSLATAVANLATLTTAYSAHTHTWASITGKPAGLITHSGFVAIGNVAGSGGQEFTVTIPDQGTSAYDVLFSLSFDTGVGVNNANSIVVLYKLRSATEFKFWVREWEAVNQDLIFNYKIIK